MSESPEDAPVPGEEERDFQKVLALVGGKERIYLVSDACGRDEVGEDDADVLREFMRDMFHGYAESPGACQPSAEDERSGGALTSKADHEQPPARNGHRQRTATRDSDVSSRRRAIDAPLIIFLFRQTFVSRGANARCVKEILKDVRARAQRAGARRPALIGLIRTRLERAETHLCAQSLERVIRAVFHAHPPETIWVGCFTPRAESATLSIKKNACRVLQASQKAGGVTSRHVTSRPSSSDSRVPDMKHVVRAPQDDKPAVVR